jgi:hypothetical protein
MASDSTVDDPPAGPPAAVEASGCPFSGAPGPAAGGRPRPKRGYLLPGTIALVVCAAIATVIDVTGIQSHTPSSLPGSQVATFLSQSLQYTHPQATPPQVRCPADEPLRAGLSFRCVLVRPGHPDADILVTETSAHGTFRYQPPASG